MGGDVQAVGLPVDAGEAIRRVVCIVYRALVGCQAQALAFQEPLWYNVRQR